MYELYTDFVQEKNYTPVKLCIYRNILYKEFNLIFVKKKDLYDVCSEVDTKNLEGNLTEQLNFEYERKIKMKNAKGTERNKDRGNNDIAVLFFGVENVLSCPKAEIKNFFCNSKLSVYNMTTHLSVD